MRVVPFAGEQRLRGGAGLVRLGRTVHQRGQLVRQQFFLFVDPAGVPGLHLLDLFERDKSQHPQALHHVGVVDVAPVLIKLERRGLLRVEPDGALSRFAHFLALAVEQQGNGHGIGVPAGFFTDQFCSAEHVAPLIVAAELHVAAVMLVEVPEVVRLHDHVVELQKAQPAFHALLVTFGPQHVVDREAGAHLAQQIDVFQVQQPVGVVDDDGLVRPEVDKPADLLEKAVAIVPDGFRREHRAHVGAAGRVADIAGAAAEQHHRLVAGQLQALHQAQGHKMAHVQ